VPIQIFRTRAFREWLLSLRDRRARVKIEQRVDRLEEGNAGDVKSVGDGILEMRVDYGPGYRVYYVQRGSVCIILLCGGDKSSQKQDIQRAKVLAEQIKQEDWHAT